MKFSEGLRTIEEFDKYCKRQTASIAKGYPEIMLRVQVRSGTFLLDLGEAAAVISDVQSLLDWITGRTEKPE